ncbi:MAG: hypothetical protein ACXADL_04985 [Candidatus Thorarchaeota archaeon]
MAFEDGLEPEPSQPPTQDFTVSATGLVSRTISLWTRKLFQYIIIVGIVGAGLAVVSFVVALTLFAAIGVLGTDPITYLFNLFTLGLFPDITVIVVSLLFAIVAFVMNAIVGGAAIKFALDDYGERRGEIGLSFSHSFGKTLHIVIVLLVISFLVSIVITPGLYLSGLAMEGIDFTDPFNPDISPGAMELLMGAFFLLIIGGIFYVYISARFAPTLAIVIDTDLSAIDSLKKSWELTSGNVIHVWVGQILLIIAVIVLQFIVSMALGFVFLFNPYLGVIEVIVSALLFSSLTFIFSAVLYRDLLSRSGQVASQDWW